MGVALALLKFPAGAFTALAALIAIGGELVPGFTALDTQPQILAYALLFGYAQQLLTGLIEQAGAEPAQHRARQGPGSGPRCPATPG